MFTGDGSGNFVAFDATNGTLLWNTRIGNISNAPETYLLDGRQHVLVAAGTQLFAFVMYSADPSVQCCVESSALVDNRDSTRFGCWSP